MDENSHWIGFLRTVFTGNLGDHDVYDHVCPGVLLSLSKQTNEIGREWNPHSVSHWW